MSKPKLKLIGKDGNALSILGRARAALRRQRREEGASERDIRNEWVKIEAEATSSDYDHLLATIQEHFDVE